MVFKIQIANSSQKISLNTSKFTALKSVEEVIDDKTFKYYTGNFKTIDEAFEEQRRLRKNGFKDAFTVAFSNGKKINLNEAREMLDKSK